MPGKDYSLPWVGPWKLPGFKANYCDKRSPQPGKYGFIFKEQIIILVLCVRVT